MSEPWAYEEELLKERPLTNVQNLLKSKPKPYVAGNGSILQEAYKKHATELASIEDRQHKLLSLIHI